MQKGTRWHAYYQPNCETTQYGWVQLKQAMCWMHKQSLSCFPIAAGTLRWKMSLCLIKRPSILNLSPHLGYSTLPKLMPEKSPRFQLRKNASTEEYLRLQLQLTPRGKVQHVHILNPNTWTKRSWWTTHGRVQHVRTLNPNTWTKRSWLELR